MSPLVQLQDHPEQAYQLLTPTSLPPREGSNFNLLHPIEYFDAILASIRESRIVAVDFETNGSDYTQPDFRAVVLGLAWDEGSCAFNLDSLTQNQIASIRSLLQNHKGLIAHNVYFDGGVAQVCLEVKPQWAYCTYSTLAMLANEGYEGRWGLKNAQKDLLLWPETNEQDLDEWLVSNGYYKGNVRKDMTSQEAIDKYRQGTLKPDKGQMYQAPFDILARYCVLDSESTYLLFTGVLAPTLNVFPDLDAYLQKEWMYLIEVHIQQKLYGIQMDRQGLVERKNYLQEVIRNYNHQFLNHPDTLPHIQDIEKDMLKEKLAKEPPARTKSGKVSRNWINWDKQVGLITSRQDPDYLFNMQSGDQLRELLYNRMGFPALIFSEKGEPSVANKAVAAMGEIGKLLQERAWASKELTYIEKYLDLTQDRDTIHPSFRLPGTTTGRLSSKDINIQQVPKSKAVMSLFQARPGRVFVDLDFSALEPVVATEFSQDRNMMQIYGNGRPANDLYCFVMSAIPGMAEKAASLGYDPFNPTPESLARVKKEMKRERSICKVVALSAQYGAGPRKIHQTLEEQEVFLSLEEVQEIYDGYWKLFAELKQFGRDLQFKRRKSGYVLNGIGRPMSIPDDWEKDSLNRFIQATGHDVLVMYVYTLGNLLTQEGINWKPIIMDWHDSSAVEVPEQDRDRTVACFNRAMHLLNQKLGGTIKLKGTPSFGYNMAEIKEPEN